MGDRVLAYDVRSISEAGADVVTEVGVDGWYHLDTFSDTRDTAKQVDCSLKASCKQSRTGQEQVSYRCRLKVEDARWPCSFDNLHVDSVEEGANAFTFLGTNREPKWMGAFDYAKPFQASRDRVFGKAEVKECFEGVGFWIAIGWDETDETTCDVLADALYQ